MQLSWEFALRYLVPLVSAPFFLTFLIYFTLIRKRIAREYPYYACFLIALIIFLTGGILAFLPTGLTANDILFVRMVALLGFGLPALCVATGLQSGVTFTTAQRNLIFAFGTLLTLAYVASADIALGHGLLASLANLDYSTVAPVLAEVRIAHAVQILATVSLLNGPVLYFLFRPGLHPRPVAYLGGVFAFGFFLILGTLAEMWWLPYTGSIVSVLFWGLQIVREVHHMRGRMALLKDELLVLARRGGTEAAAEFARRLEDLEELSEGHLDVYKLRIREILAALGEAMIEAEIDADTVVRRHADRTRAIDESHDAAEIRAVVNKEVAHLADALASRPAQRRSHAVSRALAFLQANFTENIGIDDVVAHVGVSRSSLLAAFKRETGKTINACLTDLRIARACELLRTHSVTETAFAVGFNNSGYFSTVFRRKTGQTPTEYQQAQTSEPSRPQPPRIQPASPQA